MALFFYRAKDEKGRIVSGKVQADSEDALQDRLTKTGYFILEIRQESNSVMKQDFLEMMRGISTRDYIMLLTHMYVTLEAGIPILKILDSVSEQCHNVKLSLALKEVRADIAGGLPMSAAMKKQPKVFSGYFTSMISVGETTGKLAEVLQKLTVFLEKEEEIKQKTSSVLTYPIILLTVTVGAVTFLMAYIMPKFIAVFESSKVALPLPTQILVAISGGIQAYWLYMLIGVVSLVIAFRFYISTEAGRYAFDDFQLRIPLFGKIYRQIYAIRFMNTFSTLYSGGVPIESTLTLVQENIGNKVFAKITGEIKEGVQAGRDIGEVMSVYEAFPSDARMMIASGVESGKLTVMLNKAAQLYEKETDYMLKTLGSLMEPAIILTLGFTVGFVALGIMLPIFNMSRAVHG